MRIKKGIRILNFRKLTLNFYIDFVTKKLKKKLILRIFWLLRRFLKFSILDIKNVRRKRNFVKF